MTPLGFWTELFSGQVRELAPEGDNKNVAIVLSSNHRSLYGGYLGPSSLSHSGNGCVWTFDDCEHGNRCGTCEAHLGYLRGTLIGMGLRKVAVTRDWDRPKCRLAISWE